MSGSVSGFLEEGDVSFPLWGVVVIASTALIVLALVCCITVVCCQVQYRRRHRTRYYTASDPAKQPVQRLNSVYSIRSQDNIVRLADSPHHGSPLTNGEAAVTTSSLTREPSQTAVRGPPSSSSQPGNDDPLYDNVLTADPPSVPAALTQASNDASTHNRLAPSTQSDTMTTNATEFEQSQLAEVNLADFPVSPSEYISPQPSTRRNTPSRPHFTFEDGTTMQQVPGSVDPEIEGDSTDVTLNFPQPPNIYSSQILQTVPSDKDTIELQGVTCREVSSGGTLDINDFADEYVIRPELDVPIVILQTPKTTSDESDHFIMLNSPPAQVGPSGASPALGASHAITENETLRESTKNHARSLANTQKGNVNKQNQQQQQEIDETEALYDRLLTQDQHHSKATQPESINPDQGYDTPVLRVKPHDTSSLFDDPGYGTGGVASRRVTLDPTLLFDDPGYTRGMLQRKEELPSPRERSMTVDPLAEVQPRKDARKEKRRKVASASYENVPPGGFKKRPTKQRGRVDLREGLDHDGLEEGGEWKLKQNLSVEGASTIQFTMGSVNSLNLLNFEQQELEEMDPDIAACFEEDLCSGNEMEITQV